MSLCSKCVIYYNFRLIINFIFLSLIYLSKKIFFFFSFSVLIICFFKIRCLFFLATFFHLLSLDRVVTFDLSLNILILSLIIQRFPFLLQSLLCDSCPSLILLVNCLLFLIFSTVLFLAMFIL